jgi:quinol monooxygenase YgiN
MIVLSRFRVDADAEAAFLVQARAAIVVLHARDGLLSLDFGRSLDEPELWTITTRWADVGSYRRALSGIESKSVVVPLLSAAVDEPSAYESPELVGENWARGASRPG